LIGRAQPSIQDVLDAFLADERSRLAPRTYRNYASVVELLAHCLNGYGYQSLDELDRKRWEQAYAAGDEEAFCRLFGPDQVIGNLGEFLGYFMVRKVMAGQELLRAAGTVTTKLAQWLHDRGYVDERDYEEAAERGAEAARDLPRADQLGWMLHELAQRAPDVDADAIPDKGWVEGCLPITGVEPGALWFEGGVGPVTVPPAASALAQVGWCVTITMARLRGRWQVLEVGNVYP
jgi:hypothetical protein